MDRLRKEIERCVAAALAEDEATADATTKLLVPGSMEGAALIHSKAHGVISGQECASEVFLQMGGEASYAAVKPDGASVLAGHGSRQRSGVPWDRYCPANGPR